MAKQILLAENNAADADEILRALQKAGLTNPVVTVTDGEETLAYLRAAGQFVDREKFPLPSVLLLNLQLPRRNGLEVLEWLTLQPQLTNMLMVVLSAYDNPTEISRAYRLGAHTSLIKPIRPEDITRLKSAFYRYWT